MNLETLSHEDAEYILYALAAQEPEYERLSAGCESKFKESGQTFQIPENFASQVLEVLASDSGKRLQIEEMGERMERIQTFGERKNPLLPILVLIAAVTVLRTSFHYSVDHTSEQTGEGVHETYEKHWELDVPGVNEETLLKLMDTINPFLQALAGTALEGALTGQTDTALEEALTEQADTALEEALPGQADTALEEALTEQADMASEASPSV